MTRLATLFADAFNRRSLDDLITLLAPDATAEVTGSPFGVEQGPDDIAAKSLRHMLDEGGASLTAEVFECDGESLVLFRTPGSAASEGSAAASGSKLDTVARVAGDERITRIDYLVVWFQPDELRRIASARGIEAVTPD